MNDKYTYIKEISDIKEHGIREEIDRVYYSFGYCKVPPFHNSYVVNIETPNNKSFHPIDINSKFFRDLKEAYDYFFDLVAHNSKNIEELNRIRNMINDAYKKGTITPKESVLHLSDEELVKNEIRRDLLIKKDDSSTLNIN